MVREFYIGHCLIETKESGYPDDGSTNPHLLLPFGRTEFFSVKDSNR